MKKFLTDRVFVLSLLTMIIMGINALLVNSLYVGGVFLLAMVVSFYICVMRFISIIYPHGFVKCFLPVMS
jgi:hypothetical protein